MGEIAANARYQEPIKLPTGGGELRPPEGRATQASYVNTSNAPAPRYQIDTELIDARDPDTASVAIPM